MFVIFNFTNSIFQFSSSTNVLHAGKKYISLFHRKKTKSFGVTFAKFFPSIIWYYQVQTSTS